MRGGHPSVGTHYFAIDGIRFISALSVAVFHIFFLGWARPSSTTGQITGGVGHFESLAPFTWFGWVGVEVFFVISGLVIANSAANASAGEFAKNRMLRLYPAVWICAPITLLVISLIGPAMMSDSLQHFANSMLLLPVPDCCVDGVYWTLRVEMFFYFLVFMLLFATRFAHLALLAWVLTLASAVYLAVTWALVLGVVEHVPGWWHLTQFALLSTLIRNGCFFALGIWLWLASQRRLTPLQMAAVGITIVSGCAEIAYGTREMVGSIPAFVTLHWPVPVVFWLTAVLVMYVSMRSSSKVLHSRQVRGVLKRMGAMTYPFYLVHNVAGAGLMAVLIRNGTHNWVAAIAAILSATAISYVVCALWEPRVRGKLRPLLDSVGGFVEARAGKLKRLALEQTARLSRLS